MTTEQNNMELNEMRQQMNILKEKLNRQEIISERLLRKAIDRKISTIDCWHRRKRFYLIGCIIFVPALLFKVVHTPFWFALATLAMLAISLIYHEMLMEPLTSEDLNRCGALEVSRKALRLKEQGARWLWIGIPMLIAWMMTFIYLILNMAEFDGGEQEILGGLSTGIVIGSIIGFIIYRRQQRLIDDLRDSLEQE